MCGGFWGTASACASKLRTWRCLSCGCCTVRMSMRILNSLMCVMRECVSTRSRPLWAPSIKRRPLQPKGSMGRQTPSKTCGIIPTFYITILPCHIRYISEVLNSRASPGILRGAFALQPASFSLWFAQRSCSDQETTENRPWSPADSAIPFSNHGGAHKRRRARHRADARL